LLTGHIAQQVVSWLNYLGMNLDENKDTFLWQITSQRFGMGQYRKRPAFLELPAVP
jgi:hypothetical protein